MNCLSYRYVALLLGLLLLVTGGLKTHAVFADSPLEGGFLANRWAVLGVAELEFALGAWLLTGYRPADARRCSLVVFTCFFGFSLASALAGEHSCSCFGVLAVSPWFTVTIDVAAVCALSSCRPQADTSPRSLSYPKMIFIILIFGLLVLLPTTFAISDGAQRPLLVPSEQVLDLGVLSMGSRRSATLWLTYKGTAPVEIERVHSSCHCLKLQGAPRIIFPSQTIRTIVTLDLGKEPTFTGNLRVNVLGWTQTGGLAFSIQVTAKVRDP